MVLTTLGSIFKRAFCCLAVFALPSCSLETTMEGEFLLDKRYKLVKEFKGEAECSITEMVFALNSYFYCYADETYNLVLNRNDGTQMEMNGNYRIVVGEEGHSGEGYFTFEEKTFELTFKESYFLIFSIQASGAPDEGAADVRTLYFQWW